MGTNIVPVLAAPKAQFMVLYNGLPLPHVKSVKLPAAENGVMTSQPGGRTTPMYGSSGNRKWEDTEIVCYQNSPATTIPDPLDIWFEACLNPESGLGLPVVTQAQNVTVIEQDATGIPIRTHGMVLLPFKRDEGSLEGGSDDPKEITYSFKTLFQRAV